MFEVFEEMVVVDSVGGGDPVILETPSSRHTNKGIVENANVTGVRVVVTSSRQG